MEYQPSQQFDTSQICHTQQAPLPQQKKLDYKVTAYVTIWASSWGYGTYHIGNHIGYLCCSHTWSMEIDDGSDQKSDN